MRFLPVSSRLSSLRGFSSCNRYQNLKKECLWRFRTGRKCSFVLGVVISWFVRKIRVFLCSLWLCPRLFGAWLVLWIRLGLGSGSLSRWSLSGNGPLCKYRNFSKSLAAKYTLVSFSPLLLDLAANISSCSPCPCIHVSTQNEGYLPTVWKTPLLCLSLLFYSSKRNGFEELCSKLWHRLRHFILTVQPSVSTCLIQKHRN